MTQIRMTNTRLALQRLVLAEARLDAELILGQPRMSMDAFDIPVAAPTMSDIGQAFETYNRVVNEAAEAIYMDTKHVNGRSSILQGFGVSARNIRDRLGALPMAFAEFISRAEGNVQSPTQVYEEAQRLATRED